MRPVQLAVAVDHFRFDPQSEVHAQTVHLVGQRTQSAGEGLLAGGPVAEPGPVVAPGAEPAVVQDEEFGADAGGQLRQLDLAGLVDIESGGLPGVVEHRPVPARLRQHVFAYVVVPGATGRAEAVGE